MPYADANGVKLYYEEAGRGTPIVFVHEFADDLYSWEAQMRFFSRRYRCVAFNARGYPPSDVPKSASKYSQAIATDDVANVMRSLKIRKAPAFRCSTPRATARSISLTRALCSCSTADASPASAVVARRFASVLIVER